MLEGRSSPFGEFPLPSFPLSPDQRTQIQDILHRSKDVHLLRRAWCLWMSHLAMPAAEIAQAIGWNVASVYALRSRFRKNPDAALRPEGPGRGGRRNEHLSLEEEAEFLAPFIELAREAGVIVIGPVRRALEQRLGREVSESTVYRMLHRHGWRKIVPRQRHPKAPSGEEREAWKKNSPARPKRSPNARRSKR
jgi:transposase